MKKKKYNYFSSSFPKLRQKNIPKYECSKIIRLRIYINNIFFISISFLSVSIFYMINNSLSNTFFHIYIYTILNNTIIKNSENLIKKRFKEFARLSPCIYPLLEPINISYVDFWSDFQHKDFYFQKFFENNSQINVLDNITDNISYYLMYSAFGNNHYNVKYRKCIKIFYTGENQIPDFSDADYSIGFSYIKLSDRYIRFPLYILYSSIREINKNVSMKRREKFCAMVTSNGGYNFRNYFFYELAKYKKIDSGGKFENNIDRIVIDKTSFLSEYKFSIQMENSATPGYSTEKLLQGLRAGTIPIYHGDESIINIVNPKSFIFVKDESDFNYTISLIKDLDNNDKKYNKMKNQKVILEEEYLKDEESKINNFIHVMFRNNKKYTNVFNDR